MCLFLSSESGLLNVRLVHGDAVLLLEAHMQNNVLDDTYIFFPDPWLGDRDADRRMVRPEVVQAIASCTRPGGMLHVATDVREYAEWVKKVMASEVERSHWEDLNSTVSGYLETRPEWRPVTKYEKRGVEELGNDIYDMCYRCSDSSKY